MFWNLFYFFHFKVYVIPPTPKFCFRSTRKLEFFSCIVSYLIIFVINLVFIYNPNPSPNPKWKFVSYLCISCHSFFFCNLFDTFCKVFVSYLCVSCHSFLLCKLFDTFCKLFDTFCKAFCVHITYEMSDTRLTNMLFTSCSRKT